MIIGAATEGDVAAIAAIYGHHVLTGLGTFEEVPPDEREIAARVGVVLALGLPYLVASDDGGVLGFAYAAPFRRRAAYRYTVEDSVYVRPDRLGQGVGKGLLAAVVEACERVGLRQMVAVIGNSANAGSIGLHRSLGFATAGVVPGVGYKAGRWTDIVIMRRPLNGGDAAAPIGPGLTLGGD